LLDLTLHVFFLVTEWRTYYPYYKLVGYIWFHFNGITILKPISSNSALFKAKCLQEMKYGRSEGGAEYCTRGGGGRINIGLRGKFGIMGITAQPLMLTESCVKNQRLESN
jgi:hypothetical protein